MILGISGRIGSGKNTVAKIMQWLCSEKLKEVWLNDLQCYLNDNELNNSEQEQWEVHKFAGKLKDIVCLMIGCTREELEDEDFKNTPLGPDWTKYKIIRKDSDRRLFNYASLEEAEIHAEKFNGTVDAIELTPRLILQSLGTECGRDLIHPNVWVNSLFADYKVKLAGYEMQGESVLQDLNEPDKVFTCIGKRHLLKDDTFKTIVDYPNWLITDMRFPNEMRAVETRKGLTLRIDRETELRFPELWAKYEAQDVFNHWEDFLKAEDEYDRIYHRSETSLDEEKIWDYYIKNDGTLEQLIEQVRGILVDMKIIEDGKV